MARLRDVVSPGCQRCFPTPSPAGPANTLCNLCDCLWSRCAIGRARSRDEQGGGSNAYLSSVAINSQYGTRKVTRIVFESRRNLEREKEASQHRHSKAP